MLGDHFTQTVENGFEALGELRIGCADDTARDIGELLSDTIDQAEAGDTQTRIHTEDADGGDGLRTAGHGMWIIRARR
jgi:hypothetical protein